MSTQRSTIAERVRELDPELAEAIEEELFDDAELAEMARMRAFDYQSASSAFFTFLKTAADLEDLS